MRAEEFSQPADVQSSAATQRLTGTLAKGGWRLDWHSVLTSRYGPIRIDSPATAGRPVAGYGGIFWRLPSADTITVLSEAGEGTDAAYGSMSLWLAFIRQRADTITTLPLVQPGTDVRPWFLRSDCVGPALAWQSTLVLQADQDLPLALTALLLDRSVDLTEAPGLAAKLQSPRPY